MYIYIYGCIYDAKVRSTIASCVFDIGISGICYMLPYVSVLTRTTLPRMPILYDLRKGGGNAKLVVCACCNFSSSQNHSASLFFLGGFDKHLRVTCCRPRKYVGGDT
jgi:hypothetical protein